MNLPEQIERSIQERKLFRNGARILVAVSGGVDSMALLAILQELAKPQGWKLFVAHFNHQLRGRASDGDERLVQRTAKKLGLPFHAGRGKVMARAAEQGISIEMAARELRHQFLAKTARRLKCPLIAIAHHADDQVELFFLRLLRGAGGEGLAGMKGTSPSPADRKVRIVRPLLDVSKAELEAFVCERKIRFREDATNASCDVLRNRVRHELLPRLRKDFQPVLNRTVLRLMELVGGEAELVGALAQDWLAKSPGGSEWDALPSAVQRRVVQLQLQQLKLVADFDLVERLRLMPGKAVSVAERHVVRQRDGRVKWVDADPSVFSDAKLRLNLVARKSVSFNGLELSWDFTQFKRGKHPGGVEKCEFFDADQVGDNIILRHWQPGDRFQPIGMKTAVKLQDWFTNQKIAKAVRHELVLAATKQGVVFWIQGLRIGESFKLTDDTRRVLVWHWRVR